MPSFEWTPGVEITDVWKEDNEEPLAIVQNLGEIFVEEYPVQMIEDGATEDPQQQQEDVPSREMQDLHEIVVDKLI